MALGATARVPKGSASTKSMRSGGWWAGRQGAAAGTRARDATRAATECASVAVGSGRSGGFAADQAVLWNISPREDEGWW